MSIDEAKEELSRMKGHHYFTHGDEALDMAIHALEMQKKLAEYSGTIKGFVYLVEELL